MKSRSGFVKTAIIVMVMAVLLPVSAAYSADWQTNVNGYPIQCEVTGLSTHIDGNWLAFFPLYTFCNGNYWKLDCVRGSKDGVVDCGRIEGPKQQSCNGATYRMQTDRQGFPLEPRTANAQNYVCGEAFKRMNVTVTPLK